MNRNNLNWVDNRVFGGSQQKSAPPAEQSFSESQVTTPFKEDPVKTSMPNSPQDNTYNQAAKAAYLDPPVSEIPFTYDPSLVTEQGPPPVFDINYIPGYLRENIGKNVRAEFAIGGSNFVDKTGILRQVGVNYFVLEDYITHGMIMCDLYSVKFVTTI